MSEKELEEGSELRLDFAKLEKVAATGFDVLPVVVQEVESSEVLIVAYVNEQALAHTRKTGKATFWSTSRNELWVKGETSGNILEIVEILVNCEQNSILYRVRLAGAGACHTESDGVARQGCYYRRLNADGKLEHIKP